MKYYTAFAWDEDPHLLHATHKYLGAISIEDERQTKAFLRHVFEHWIKVAFAPKVIFDTAEFFGAGSDIRVLTASDKITEARFLSFFSHIRDQLNEVRVDDFKFRFHVSTPDQKIIDKPFARYVLMRGPEVSLSIPIVQNCSPEDFRAARMF